MLAKERKKEIKKCRRPRMFALFSQFRQQAAADLLHSLGGSRGATGQMQGRAGQGRAGQRRAWACRNNYQRMCAKRRLLAGQALFGFVQK